MRFCLLQVCGVVYSLAASDSYCLYPASVRYLGISTSKHAEGYVFIFRYNL